MNYKRRKDLNENEIVEYALKRGYVVERLYYVGRGVPDLLVGGLMPCPICGQHYWQERLVEVKQPGENLRPNQAEWWRKWNGNPRIAHTTEELDRLVGRDGTPGIWNGEGVGETGRRQSRKRGAPGGGQKARVSNPGGAHPVSQDHRP